MTSVEIFNLYRSLYSFRNITTSFNNDPVKLIGIAKVSETEGIENRQPGHVVFSKKSKQLLVKCADASYLEIRQLSFGKKKAMSAADFNNGFLKKLKECDRRFQ